MLANTPTIDKVIRMGVSNFNCFAGGEIGVSEQPTKSGPGWMSILTGVWAHKHKVMDNEFIAPNFAQYPSLFSTIFKACPQAALYSIVNWRPINEHILMNASYCFDVKDDARVTTEVVKTLREKDPHVVFVHLDEVDAAGHQSFAREDLNYLNAIGQADKHISQMLDALIARGKYADEDWLVLITSDHGGIDSSHGGQAPSEREVFVIAMSESYRGGRQSHLALGHTTVTPTILQHLNILMPRDKYDAEPLSDCCP